MGVVVSGVVYPMTCQCGRRRIPWGFYASLLLAVVCVAVIVRTDKEYRQVRQIREAGDSLLDSWYAKKCVPR